MMLTFLAILGFGLYVLCRIGWRDLQFLLGRKVTVKARILSNDPVDDGYFTEIVFQHDQKKHEVQDLYSTGGLPVGSRVWVSFPAGKPHLARRNMPAGQVFFYLVAITFLAIGAAGLLGWIG